MENKEILISARDIESKYHISYSSIMKARREGTIRGVKIGHNYLFDEENVIKPWVGLKPSTDEVMMLKMENEKLQNQINMYKNQYKMIRQLLDALNGTVNVI
ncbi:hypothetical protein [Faecalibacillus faecis]|uniref:hypothetical protein n=1 Tax=Faecalibacillus faecis TaxID=1982628 RepID=UPI0038646D51